MSIRLIIADDHQILIDGILAIVKEMPEIEVVGTVNNGQDLIDKLGNTPANLVLLDLNMPEMDGIEALKVIKKDYPDTKVIVLSNYQQIELTSEIRNLGAEGYLLKSISTPILKEAILKVHAGELWFETLSTVTTDEKSYFIDEFMQKYKLTKREVQIIGMMADQLTSKEISDNLFISEFTVVTHRRNIMRKLNVKNLAGVVSFANEHHLVGKRN